MSGMKFRRTCSSCNVTFFSPDRKAAYCLKCLKKKVIKHVPAEVRVPAAEPRVEPAAAPRPSARPGVERRSRPARLPKASTLTPELKSKITELYEREYAQKSAATRDLHNEIAGKLWVKRQLVADVVRELTQAKTTVTADQKSRAIEMYCRFVETGYRPEGGRRRAISVALNLPYKQVVKIIREWSVTEYSHSSTPTPTRTQLFEIEKTYWNELKKGELRLTAMPEFIAETLGYVTRWQVLRWLDVLHDDERAFAKVPDPPEEVREQILAAYEEYLQESEPPDQGLHYSIAGRFAKISPRQVHKVLQSHRHRVRSEYPLI